MIPNPYTFAVLAVTRQFPEVLRHPLGGGASFLLGPTLVVLPRFSVVCDSVAPLHLPLAAVDVLARVAVKDAASCDTHSDVRNSVNCRVSNA